ncbi:hypothetical protein B0J11DRAFT_563100 [Dendryphion nanum]|uniref:BTB domain-containing protein n=1 Tax=Dendryphion nanum TaxID=256645 RepID=A0A9P9IWD8_9PLEO|nr:hypothetical protein B0J11DRAFT_563100 [Dendryphion nanum]
MPKPQSRASTVTIPRRDPRVNSDKVLKLDQLGLRLHFLHQNKDYESVQEVVFFIDEHSLKSRSDFFRRATNGNWKESDDRVINMPDDDPELVELYLKIIRLNQIPTKQTGDDSNPEDEFKILYCLYVLAERFQDPKTKNTIIDAFLAMTLEIHPGNIWFYPCLSCIRIIYEGTCKNSLARKFLVDYWMEHGKDAWTYVQGTHFLVEFYEDLVQAMFSHRTFTARFSTLTCDPSRYYEDISTKDA